MYSPKNPASGTEARLLAKTSSKWVDQQGYEPNTWLVVRATTRAARQSVLAQICDKHECDTFSFVLNLPEVCNHKKCCETQSSYTDYFIALSLAYSNKGISF